MNKIKVAIIDDHQVVINGLKAMFSVNNHVEVVFATTSSEELTAFLTDGCADVLILDIQMPNVNGVDLCRMIARDFPSLRIIAFTSFDDTHYIRQVMRSGASGYVLKNADQEVLVEALKVVVAGGDYIDESIKKALIHESITGQKRSMYEIPLTKREREILKLVAEECSNQEIADKLFISLRTVETHRSNLNQKLGAKNTVSLVKEAIKRGFIDG